MPVCMSATMACNDFLQTSGKWPSSLTMPPFCPPMPRAQVLQAFFERMAFQSFQSPPASRALENVYMTAGQPPPEFTFRIDQVFRKRISNQTLSLRLRQQIRDEDRATRMSIEHERQ